MHMFAKRTLKHLPLSIPIFIIIININKLHNLEQSTVQCTTVIRIRNSYQYKKASLTTLKRENSAKSLTFKDCYDLLSSIRSHLGRKPKPQIYYL